MLQHIKKIFVVSFVILGLGITANPITPVLASETKTLQYAKVRYAKEQKLKKEITCLARNIYFESGTEPYKGKMAVAQVTINRVNSGQFPSSVCGVVHQKSKIEGTTVCQFSWTCETNLKIRSPERYDESVQVAKRFMLDGVRMPELKHALFFHADYIKPGWNKRPKAKIGRHIFY